MSDGSDEGGSDVYASDAEKYENLEEFDFDHQVKNDSYFYFTVINY